MIKISQSRNRKKTVIISVISIIILITAIVVYLSTSNAWFREHFMDIKESSQSENSSKRPINDVDYSGPSKTDTDSSQEGKKKNDEASTKTPQSSAPVAVSFADIADNSVEVRAFIPGLIESGGKCTATFTQDSKKVTKSSDSFVDASSSQCNPIFIPLSEFPSKGAWSLVVSYSSPSAKGNSETIEIKI